MTAIAGSVAELWRFPVKSMQGDQVPDVEVTARGIMGDRAHALIDAETGKVASAKSVKLFPELLACRAVLLEPPHAKREAPPVRIELPNGTSVTSDTTDVDRTLSAVTVANRAGWTSPSTSTTPMSRADPGGNPNTRPRSHG